jgi:hypothetical protein
MPDGLNEAKVLASVEYHAVYGSIASLIWFAYDVGDALPQLAYEFRTVTHGESQTHEVQQRPIFRPTGSSRKPWSIRLTSTGPRQLLMTSSALRADRVSGFGQEHRTEDSVDFPLSGRS